MRNTIYATFSDPKLADKAAETLIHRGVRAEDLRIIETRRWSGEDSVVDLFKSLGVAKHVAEDYEQAVEAGGAILGATMPSGELEEANAWDVFTKFAATHVTSFVSTAYLG